MFFGSGFYSLLSKAAEAGPVFSQPHLVVTRLGKLKLHFYLDQKILSTQHINDS